jgi:hypothetical protein
MKGLEIKQKYFMEFKIFRHREFGLCYLVMPPCSLVGGCRLLGGVDVKMKAVVSSRTLEITRCQNPKTSF